MTSTLNAWSTGYTADIKITNNGPALSSWRLTFTVGDAVTVSNGWNGVWSQSGRSVTVTNPSWGGSLGNGATTSVGFQAAFNGSAGTLSGFALNGTPCNA